jgi:hypothetical protein
MFTKITQRAFRGEPYTGERDLTDNRRLNPRKSNRSKTAKPARTRAGASFPGGKHLRRALARLSARQNAATGTKPGSMT